MFNLDAQAVIQLIFLSVVCWRLSMMLFQEYGPFDIIVRFRDWIGVLNDPKEGCSGKNVLAKLFCCYKCLSVWIGLFLAILFYRVDVLQTIILALFFSGATIFIEEKL